MTAIMPIPVNAITRNIGAIKNFIGSRSALYSLARLYHTSTDTHTYTYIHTCFTFGSFVKFIQNGKKYFSFSSRERERKREKGMKTHTRTSRAISRFYFMPTLFINELLKRGIIIKFMSCINYCACTRAHRRCAYTYILILHSRERKREIPSETGKGTSIYYDFRALRTKAHQKQ